MSVVVRRRLALEPLQSQPLCRICAAIVVAIAVVIVGGAAAVGEERLALPSSRRLAFAECQTWSSLQPQKLPHLAAVVVGIVAVAAALLHHSSPCLKALKMAKIELPIALNRIQC